MTFNKNWGNNTENILKYKYINETNKYNSEVTEKQMTKEELEDYLKGLEVRNKWKTKKVF